MITHNGPGSRDLADLPYGVYCGARFDGVGIVSKYEETPQFFRVLVLVDFPFSAAADTVVLPYDLATLHTGSLRVTVDASDHRRFVSDFVGKWRLDGGPWQDSGATLSHLKVGKHSVSFSPVNGWQTPGPQEVDLPPLQITTNTGVYSPPLRWSHGKLEKD